MSEKITRLSAGVKANEIDLSAVTAPAQLEPTGVPAGVIGTAKSGPAFVPVTVPNSTEFVKIFGDSKGNEIGPIALREWLKNASAGTYVRVLGAGDGKEKSSSGLVTNAGFVVGEKLVQGTGDIGDTQYANGSTPIQTASRTYFVGCLMSESNGSTFLSDAGLQQTDVGSIAATATITTTGNPGNDETFTLTDASGLSVSYIFKTGVTTVDGSTDTGGEVIIGVSGATGSAAAVGDRMRAAIEASALGVNTPVEDSAGVFTLTQSVGGASGNTSIDMSGVTTVTSTNFSGGVDANRATPILRGVIFAPQGINLKLEAHATHGEANVTDAPPVISTEATADGPFGASTGSISNGHQATLYLNGYNQSTNRSIQFSFDPDSPQYISNALNTDPLMIEEKGHYLYADFPVYRSQAVSTGSGAILPGNYNTTGEPIAFLLTGSAGRNSGSSKEPNFENFENRYQRAFSPMFISQATSGVRHNLFRISALSDGLGPSTQFKICIQNIKPSTDPQYEYGTFDLVIRKFDDTDRNPIVLESFTGLSLDPNSEKYICRVIGDQKISFNFDDDAESQSVVVEGEYTNRSSYIRIEPSSQLKSGQTPAASVPFGVRGHYHLQTSGSALSLPDERNNTLVVSGAIGNKIVQPPIPMIQKLTIGTGNSAKLNSNIYWGPQFSKVQSVSDPNKTFASSDSILNFTKYFGDFRTDIANMWVGDNENAADDPDLGVVNSDLFNFNMFALDKVQVVTGSDRKADPTKWNQAIYVRKGNITNDPESSEKTRALQVSDLTKVANRKYAKFTTFLQGGWNGVNIFDSEKSILSDAAAHREFSNEATQGGVEGPTVASYRKAIDIMATDADVDIKLLAIPGQRNQGVTDYAISAVESRFDAMYVMDLQEKDANNSVVTGSLQTPDISNTIASLKDKGINTSFAATYFPDIVIEHPDRATNITVPPSVVVLGAFSQNDSIGHPWFAPAGFSRASLQSSVQSTMSLNQENLDDLYDSKINPITSFAGTNLVIWGQKTLQQSSNALDRVNVRRLLIEIRRLIRDAANQIIFEPNREETLAKFKSLVDPILQNVQDNQGLARYKVVIDTTTTTQADVENNTVRGKILLQPNKTIEFVALDFVVTNAGTQI